MLSTAEAPTPDDVRQQAAVAYREHLLQNGSTESPTLDGVRSVAGDTISDENAVALANRVHLSELIDPSQSMGFHGAMVATVELVELPDATVEALQAAYPYLNTDEASNG